MSAMQLSIPVPERLAAAREAIESGTRQLTETLENLVEEIEQKNAELSALRARPLTRSSMEAAVKRCIDGLEPIGVIDPSLLEYGRTDAVQAQLRGLSAAQLLALVLPEALQDSLMRMLDYRAQDRGGWTSEADRAAEQEREHDLELEVEELTSALAAARKAAWRAGVEIAGHERPAPRRPDAPSISTFGPGASL